MAARKPPRGGAAARALGASLAVGFGKAGIYLPDPGALRPRVIPTMIDPIDVATGIGGFPEGRVIVLHGPQSCGKTTAAGRICAKVQSMGGYAVYIDGERKLDLPYMGQQGVDLDSLIVARPRYIEESFQLIEKVASHVREDKGDLESPIVVIWDSIHSLPAKRTYDNPFEKEQYSPEAAAYDRGFKKGVGIVSDARILLIFISQVRMSPDGFIVKEKVGIGKAVGHAASIIFQFKAPKPIGKVGAGRTGNLVGFTIPKNQVSRPWRSGEFSLMFEGGIDIPGAVLNAAKATGLAKPDKGGWFNIETADGVIRVQGAGGLAKMQASDPAAFEALRDFIRGHASDAPPDIEAPEEGADEVPEGAAEDEPPATVDKYREARSVSKDEG